MAPLDSAARKLAEQPAPPYRVAPHNIEAEQALLGAILVNNEALYRVSDFLEPQHFFEPVHQQIYDLSRSLIRTGKLASPVTLKTFLPADVDIAGLTVAQYLARLAAEATTIINAVDYGRTVYDLAIRRDLIRIGEDMVNVAFDAPVDFAPREQIEDAERRLYDLAEIGRYGGGFQKFETALTTAVDMAARAYQRDGKLSGLATGLKDLDNKMGGLQPSDLIIVAGRPGMGKTALATNIAYNVARAWRGEVRADGHIDTVNGGIVGFFSLEMSAEQLATRIIAEQSGIPSSTIRRGGINERDFEKIKDVAIELQHLPFFIDETGGLTVAQLAARARRLKRQKGMDLLVIDYIQLLQGSTRRSQENRVQEVTEITTSLKALAKELNLPIMALSQLSRQVENRDDKRPQLSDLRELGSIEQDADVVMFVFREEYYLSNKEPRPGSDEHIKWQTEMDRRPRQGRGHHRQAAPWSDRHRQPAVRRGGDPLRQPRARDQLPTGFRSHPSDAEGQASPLPAQLLRSNADPGEVEPAIAVRQRSDPVPKPSRQRAVRALATIQEVHMCSLRVLCAAIAGAVPADRVGGVRGQLAQPGDPGDQPVHRRQRQRHRRAHRARPGLEADQPVDHDREPAGRRRDDRRRHGRQGRAGRLYDLDAFILVQRRAGAAQEPALRHVPGFRAGDPVRNPAERAGERAFEGFQDASPTSSPPPRRDREH